MKKAKKQLMALWLNVVSGLLFMDSPLHHPFAPNNETVREFIEWAEYLILYEPTQENLLWVNDIATDINEDADGGNDYRYIDPVVGRFKATASDPGSDDLTFTWDNGKGDPLIVHVHYNDPGGIPEPPYPPYPSPWGIYPFFVEDELIVGYPEQLNQYYVCLVSVEDDDGGVGSGHTTCAGRTTGGKGPGGRGSVIGTRDGGGSSGYEFSYMFYVTYREIEYGFIIAEVWIEGVSYDPDVVMNLEGGFLP
jgi:hypothetical protein